MQQKLSPMSQNELDRRLANLDRVLNENRRTTFEHRHHRATRVQDAFDTPEGVAKKAAADRANAEQVAEQAYQAKVAAQAAADLYAAWLHSAPVVKLIAKPAVRPSKPPCYMVTTEDSQILVPATDHPLADGAATLLALHGLPEETPLALYHEGKGYPAFGPMKLGTAAACGLQRQVRRGSQTGAA